MNLNRAVAKSRVDTVLDMGDISYKNVNWDNFSFYMSVVGPGNAPIREKFWCLRKCFCDIEEGTGGWSMKQCLLADW